MHKRGFTFIELIVSMVLASILGVFLSGILSRSVQSYTAASSRATIGAGLAAAFDTLNFDLQNVIPNTTRVTTSGSTYAVEFFNAAYGPFLYRVGAGSSNTPGVCNASCTTSYANAQAACASAQTACQAPCVSAYNSCFNDCGSNCPPSCSGVSDCDASCSATENSCIASANCTTNYNNCMAAIVAGGNYNSGIGSGYYANAAPPTTAVLTMGAVNINDTNASDISPNYSHSIAMIMLGLSPNGGVNDMGTPPGSTYLYNTTVGAGYGMYQSESSDYLFGTNSGTSSTYYDYAGETFIYTHGPPNNTSQYAFPFDSANKLVFFPINSRNPVSYICVPSTNSAGAGTGTLTKYWGYTRTTAQPVAAPSGANSSIVAQGVSACSFSVNGTIPTPLVLNGTTTTASPSFLTIYMQITDSNGEAGTLVQEIPLNLTY